MKNNCIFAKVKIFIFKQGTNNEDNFNRTRFKRNSH